MSGIAIGKEAERRQTCASQSKPIPSGFVFQENRFAWRRKLRTSVVSASLAFLTLECEQVIPAEAMDQPMRSNLALRCASRVVRLIAELHEGTLAVASQLKDYTIQWQSIERNRTSELFSLPVAWLSRQRLPSRVALPRGARLTGLPHRLFAPSIRKK